jgi:hypothetical protein
MNRHSDLPQFLCRDVSKWPSSILRLMMAAHIIAALVALPEWQIAQITAVWINFRAVCESRKNESPALAAPDVHVSPSLPQASRLYCARI